MKMMRIILLCEFCYFVFSPLLHADGVQLNLHIKSLSFESYERQKVTFELGEKGKFIKILARWEDGKTVAVTLPVLPGIRLNGEGLTVIPVTAAYETLTVVVPVTPPAPVAVIVAVPTPTAVTTPGVAFTVATLVVLLDQLTV